MSGGPLPPERVPTLTEVVAWPHAPAASAPPPVTAEATVFTPPPAAATPVEAAPASEAPAGAGPALRRPEEQMIEGVLSEVQRQVELMLEYRLREVLSPLLARAADGIVRDARGELASTLRDVVSRAVTQELARHRTR